MNTERSGCRTLAWWYGAVVMLGLLPVGAGGAVAPPERLAAWRFEGPRLAAEDGTVPLRQAGIETVPGRVGQAVEFRSGEAVLTYPFAARGERDRLQASAMSLRFFYRPAWSSTGVGEGRGPGEVARLVGLGDRLTAAADGWWALTLSADGTRLEVSGGAGERDTWSTRSTPLRLKAGVWVQVHLNVFPGRVTAYVDDQLVIEQSPARFPGPGGAALRRGLAFGGRVGGGEPARGALDEVELHSAPLDRLEIFKLGRVMSAEALPGSGGLEVRWHLRPTDRVEVERAEGGATNWSRVAEGVGLMRFRDGSVEPGRFYQYRLVTNQISAQMDLIGGVRLPPVEDRGFVALLVDETVAEPLRAELDLLERDLVADGWQVIRRAVPRHDDRVWSNNTNALVRIRAGLQEAWAATERRLRCVYLIGHVAIPYAGMRAEDLHTGPGNNHYGAWPADHYYGDMDGVWTDRQGYPAYLSAPSHAITRNDPGDGKFDSEWVPPNPAGDTALELAFGRVDFANLPAVTHGGREEVERLGEYLQKVRRYRSGGLPAQPRTLVGLYFGTGTDFEMMPAAYRTSRLFGFRPEDLQEGDLFGGPGDLASVWGIQGGEGTVDRVRTGTPGVVTTDAMRRGGRVPRVLFAMLMGSWFGDWALGENNLLRSLLAAPDYGLAAFWVRHTEWRFDPLAWGGTLGDAQLETANKSLRWLDPNRGTTRTLTVLGDPTLRLHHTPPPRTVQGRRTGAGVRLTWSAPAATGLGQLIYRSTNGPSGPYRRITAEPILRREYVDTDAPAGAVYRVRTAELLATGIGSYTNLSAGVPWPAAR